MAPNIFLRVLLVFLASVWVDSLRYLDALSTTNSRVGIARLTRANENQDIIATLHATTIIFAPYSLYEAAIASFSKSVFGN